MLNEVLGRLKDVAAKTFHRVVPNKTVGILQATTLAVGTALAADAMAEEETLALDSSTPAENLVEWFGAEGPGVSFNISPDRRTLNATGPVNGPLAVNVGCPPYENWEQRPQAVPGAPTVRAGDGRDKILFQSASTERTGRDGTWVGRLTFPSRPGQTLDTTFACKTRDGRQSESLNLKVTAVAGSQGGGGSGFEAVPAPFQEEETGRDTAEDKGHMPVRVSLGAADRWTLRDPSHNFAGRTFVELAPFTENEGWYRTLSMRGRYSLGRSSEQVDGELVNPYVHVADVGLALQPVLIDGKLGALEADLGVGFGVAHKTETSTKGGARVPGKTAFAGVADAMLRVAAGGKPRMVRVGAGAECVLTNQPAIQNCGPVVDASLELRF